MQINGCFFGQIEYNSMFYGRKYAAYARIKTTKGAAICNEPQKLNKKLLGFYYETFL